ncbi:MAG: hypothetical protein L6Q37_15210, partial [Bdellovibrionaceae bacterium]|nr:hypothetical protein [Pseudobdellovibrionaceae bacterium]
SSDGPPGGTIQKITWFPDGHKLLYDKVDASSSTQSFSDLYTYDTETKITQKLTQGLRAREASVSASGNHLVFVKLKAFATELATLNIKTKHLDILWQAPLQERISSPLFLSDDEILFSLRKTDGTEGLWLFKISQRSLTPVLTEFKDIRFINLKKDTLYFTSNRNGIRNIYSVPKNQLLTSKIYANIKPLTHNYTSFLSFDVDPRNQDIYTTKITSKGPQIQFISASDYEKTPNELPAINSLLGGRYPTSSENKVNKQEKSLNLPSDKKEYPNEDYSPWRYLVPQYWIPFLTTSASDNRFILQAQTGGYDPLKHHVYNLFASFDSATQKTSVVGSYLNQTQPWTWGGAFNQLTTFFVTANNYSTSTTKSIFLSPDIWKLQKDSTFTISWKEVNTELTKSNYKRRGLGLFYLYKDFDQSLAAVSPKEGSSMYVGLNHFFSAKDYYEQTQYLLGGNYFFSGFLPENHALSTKIDVLYSPQKINSVLGASTNSLLQLQDPYTPNYLMRGYNTGHFLGETILNPKLEYRFPMREINKGHSTDPIYLRRLHGAVVADGIFLEGFAYKTTESKFEKVSTNKQFWSLGFEFRFDFNLAYQLPITTVVGIYNPLGGSFAGNSSVSTSFQISGLF